MMYSTFGAKADQIELALRRIGRWQETPLPPEKYENMGAFGEHTMSFEQWIQFILLQRIRDIIEEKGEFPTESSVAAYAVRNLDGDPHADELIARLRELDDLIEGTENVSGATPADTIPPESTSPQMTAVSQAITHSDQVPSVVYQLAEVLHEFDGDMLESQLQTFDTFILMTDAKGRQVIADLMGKAAEKAMNPFSRERILAASQSVAAGNRAAEPYDHDEAMKKYREDFKKNYLH